ncbi:MULTISPECIES: MerR family transcriptional regulator [Nocardioides]|uniref:MerR family transcriptional regulator n=1 Tax=Nocardioides vastitatis TaxID=2568655 RepID=A0ABW0ZJW2_9ACTN|nr:MerR family transcriptional regulator [Nocardioides sp.]THJ00884.1 MerR family transcriptional regulator [Nocardioides sp.]
MKSNEREIRWSVGELAERFGFETHVLRYWEDMGLLSPQRDPAGRRVYSEDDAYRVAAIITNKSAGMSLEQIRTLVDATAEDRRAALRAHLDELDRRQAEIEVSRRLTEHALECRAHDITTCPGFQGHMEDIVEGTRRGLPLPGSHLHRYA